MKNHTVAAIDIGSNAIRMKIVEFSEGGKFDVIDDLRYHTNLGKDTFSTGKVSTGSVKEVCDVLNKFKRVLKEYRIKKHRAVATTAIREASNKEYVLDRIYLSTGFKVQVIGSTEEKLLTYKAIKQKLKDFEMYKEEGMAIVDLGSGGFEMSVYNEGQFKFTNYVNLGSQRLRQILSDLETQSFDFASIMEQYVESDIYFLKPIFTEYPINRLIALGGEIKTIAKLSKVRQTEEGIRIIPRAAYQQIHRDIGRIDNIDALVKYTLSREKSEAITPSLIVFGKILEWTNAKEVIVPMVSLRDGLVADLADMILLHHQKELVIKSMIELAHNTAQRYNYDRGHSIKVAQLSMEIFNQTKEIHGLKTSHGMLLHLAAILHDIGKYIQIRNHHDHSYYIIKATDFIGITEEQKEIVSNVVRYHSDEEPRIMDNNSIELGGKGRIIISKLSAILRLADALDITHQQRINDIRIEVKEDNLIFWTDVEVECSLEIWSFNRKAKFFEEVYGMVPSIIVKER